jgi:hypothetical protein
MLINKYFTFNGDAMKKIIHFAIISFFLFPFLSAQKNDNPQLGLPIRAYLNLNNISTIFENTGISDINMDGNSGFKYPKETGKTAVFESGLIWGVKIEGDPQVRVGGSTYREGLQGGWIDALGNVIPPFDPRSRIFRIRPDVYPGGPIVDLFWESIDEGRSVNEIRNQYELDWTEWPADLGAPYYDGNQNGQYDPNPLSGDVPGIKGAIQTIWFVANDQDSARTQSLYGTLPLGIEYQATMWEYKDSLGFNNFFFRKYKLINKTNLLGTPKTFKDMYISMWSDPDVGTSNDDYVGCDTILNLGFGYNAFSNDLVYDPLPPPAVGFDLIRGPLVPGNPAEDKNKNGIDDIYDYGFNEDNQPVYGFINLPMTAFYYFIRGDSSLTDPTLGNSQGASQFYNFMQGKIGSTGAYFINPVNGSPTTYALSGNPVMGSGWIDGMLQAPDDRRLGLSTGPIQMAPGDTQVVVIAEIAGGALVGIDYLSAIDTVKKYSEIAQEFYDTAFLPPLSVNENVLLPTIFNLSQSFPNPFNPTTKIRYQVPKLSFVTLKVYDALGNEIITLVNEAKASGVYEVEFNGTRLPSGVYFYRIQSSPLTSSGQVFIDTRKMLLLK